MMPSPSSARFDRLDDQVRLIHAEIAVRLRQYALLHGHQPGMQRYIQVITGERHAAVRDRTPVREQAIGEVMHSHIRARIGVFRRAQQGQAQHVAVDIIAVFAVV